MTLFTSLSILCLSLWLTRRLAAIQKHQASFSVSWNH